MHSTTLNVFSDGTAEISQVISLTNMSSITLPLLSTQVGNILAVSGNGTAVSYEIGGGNITLSTFGVSKVTLVYDTDGLTSKQGSVWDLNLNSPYNVTLILPYQSTVLSLSRAAVTYTTVGGKPTLYQTAGVWNVSYGLPVYVPTSSTMTTVNTTPSSSGSGTQGSIPSFAIWQLAGVAAVAGAVIMSGVAVYAYRSKSRGGGPELRPDDREILGFIREKGGSVSEVEIRDRFSLPRTSAWRQAKRLEKMGLVKITKIGKQNLIGLIEPQPESGP